MTREQAAQKAKIMQAFADGETIQTKDPLDRWSDLSNPSFVRDSDCYRVKPKEPRKFIVWKKNDCASVTDSTLLLKEFELDGWEKIPVTEDIS